MGLASFERQTTIAAGLRRMEECILHLLTSLAEHPQAYDPRWVQIARDHVEQGFMAAERAVYTTNAATVKESNRDA